MRLLRQVAAEVSENFDTFRKSNSRAYSLEKSALGSSYIGGMMEGK